MEKEKIIIEFDTEKGEVTGVTLDDTAYKQNGDFEENGSIALKNILDISEITVLYIEQSPGHWCFINRRKYWCP